MDTDFTVIFVVAMTCIGLPWLILHYWTRLRAAKGISQQDEQLLDDLYSSARRLDSRLESIERIIAADNPQWKEHALPHQRTAQLDDQRVTAPARHR